MAYKRKTEDEFDIEGRYCDGWEVVTTETNRKDARAQVREYRANEPGIPFRVVKRRVRIENPVVLPIAA